MTRAFLGFIYVACSSCNPMQGSGVVDCGGMEASAACIGAPVVTKAQSQALVGWPEDADAVTSCVGRTANFTVIHPEAVEPV